MRNFFIALIIVSCVAQALTPEWLEGKVSRQQHTEGREKIQIGIHDGVYHIDKKNPHYQDILRLLKEKKGQTFSFQVDPLTLEILAVKVSEPSKTLSH